MIEWNLPSDWGTQNLGDIAPEGTEQITPSDTPDAIFNYWGLDAIQPGGFSEPAPNYIKGNEILSTCIKFSSDHILYSKLRPYLNKVIIPSISGIGSTEWVVLNPNPSLINRQYLGYVLRTQKFVDYANYYSAGGRMPRAKKSALRIAEIPIPYPDNPAKSLTTQINILSRIEAIFFELAEARRLHDKIVTDTNRLMDAVLAEVYPTSEEKLPEGWHLLPFPGVCSVNPARPRNLVNSDETMTSFVPMAAVDEREGRVTDLQARPFGEIKRGYTYFEENDVLFAKITPCMENGKAAVARGLINGFGFGSTEFHVLRPTNSIHPEWIYYFIRRETFRQEAKTKFRGAVGQQRVPQDFLEAHLIPVPFPQNPEKSLDVQQQIITRVQTTSGEVAEAQLGNTKTGALLNQMEQSILAQAFRGEL